MTQQKHNAPGLLEQAEGAHTGADNDANNCAGHHSENRPNNHADSDANNDATDRANSMPGPHLSPRQRRVIEALLGSSGWIAREALDRIAGSSNSPDVVLRLRGKLGEDAIEMRHVEALDRDNRPCRPGQYRLAAHRRAQALQLLEGAR